MSAAAMANCAAGSRGVGPGVNRRVLRNMKPSPRGAGKPLLACWGGESGRTGRGPQQACGWLAGVDGEPRLDKKFRFRWSSVNEPFYSFAAIRGIGLPACRIGRATPSLGATDRVWVPHFCHLLAEV